MLNAQRLATVIFAASILTAGTASAMESDAKLDTSVLATLKQCQQISTSCATQTDNAAGVLVFPDVVKADLIVGGAGGKGALVEHGKIVGYYHIGAASAGLQAGIESSSQVYAFRNQTALAKLEEGPDWKASATAGVTLIDADANAKAATGDVLAYVFDAKGLHAGISVDVFDVWKAGQPRPSH